MCPGFERVKHAGRASLTTRIRSCRHAFDDRAIPKHDGKRRGDDTAVMAMGKEGTRPGDALDDLRVHDPSVFRVVDAEIDFEPFGRRVDTDLDLRRGPGRLARASPSSRSSRLRHSRGRPEAPADCRDGRRKNCAAAPDAFGSIERLHFLERTHGVGAFVVERRDGVRALRPATRAPPQPAVDGGLLQGGPGLDMSPLHRPQILGAELHRATQPSEQCRAFFHPATDCLVLLTTKSRPAEVGHRGTKPARSQNLPAGIGAEAQRAQEPAE